MAKLVLDRKDTAVLEYMRDWEDGVAGGTKREVSKSVKVDGIKGTLPMTKTVKAMRGCSCWGLGCQDTPVPERVPQTRKEEWIVLAIG